MMSYYLQLNRLSAAADLLRRAVCNKGLDNKHTKSMVHKFAEEITERLHKIDTTEFLDVFLMLTEENKRCSDLAKHTLKGIVLCDTTGGPAITNLRSLFAHNEDLYQSLNGQIVEIMLGNGDLDNLHLVDYGALNNTASRKLYKRLYGMGRHCDNIELVIATRAKGLVLKLYTDISKGSIEVSEVDVERLKAMVRDHGDLAELVRGIEIRGAGQRESVQQAEDWNELDHMK
eukprot:sb/3469440/